jgi:chemosensory pili system protein ChpA (sensor histidine kinase/response regulator)
MIEMAKLSPEILIGFVEEGRPYIAQILQDLARWNGEASNGDALAASRRLVHTVKGAASMIGMPALAQTSFVLEEAMDAAIRGELHGAPARTALEDAARAIDLFLAGSIHGHLHPVPHLSSAMVSILKARNQHANDADVARQLSALESVETAEESEQPVALDSLVENFRQEAEEYLQVIGQALRSLEDNPADRSTIASIRRNVHSLKGASRAVGLEDIARLAHGLEDALDTLAEGRHTFASASKTIYRSFDAISDIVTETPVDSDLDEVLTELRALSGAPVVSQDEIGVPEDDEEIPAEFLDTFRQEADEHLQIVALRLRDLQADPSQKDAIQEIRRAVHTIKGASGVIGLNGLGALAHRVEDVLDAAWEGSLQLTPELIQIFFATADVMTDLVADPQNRAAIRPRVIELFRQFKAALGEGSPLQYVPPKAQALEEIELPPLNAGPEGPTTAAPAAAAKSTQYVRVPIERLDEMVRLVSELLVTRSVFEKHVNGHASEVGELNLSLDRLRRLSGQFDSSGFELQAKVGNFGRLNVRTAKAAKDKRSDFHALEFDRYTSMNLMSRDLAETSADISSAVGQLSTRSSDFDSCLNRLGRLTSDVQDRLMRMRMVPLSNLATRLHRTVRVTSGRLHKPADLILEGEHVEIDKTMLEELAGPLEHLLRNCVDHGLEAPAQRREAAKAIRGTVRIRAFYLGTQIVIEVSDDGAGMNADAIREKAIASGFLGAAEAAEMSDRDLFELVFQPGFSTSREVGAFSGRGVGMDVVRTAVRKLRGSIDIVSERGEGTTFRINLPMSLAILRVLLVEARGQQYAIPLGAITRILRLAEGQLEFIGQQQVLRVDGKVVPAVRLADALGNGETREEASAAGCPALIVDLGSQQLALIVDGLDEAREVVVKNLGSVLQRVRGVAGATIMGDGSIVLIVNPPELASTGSSAREFTPAQKAHRNTALDVMVVDDSVSVRRVLTNLLTNEGWSSVTARDGMEALELLQSGRVPDVVLLDMEMPRMDGYELISVLRSQPQFANLPVVMLTSRSGAKHRQRALDLGVTDYLVKPYHDESLLASLRRAAQSTAALVK